MTIIKKHFKEISVLLVSVLGGVLLLTERESVTEALSKALTVCGEILIPSLFPFMILSTFALNSGAFDKLGRLTDGMTRKIFHLPGQCLPAVIFGFIGGYPVGARMISGLYEENRISKKEGKHLWSFCINGGPAFIVTAAGGMILGSETAGWVILFSVLASSFFTGIVYSFFRRKDKITDCVKSTSGGSISSLLVSSVASASTGMASVCAWVLCFSAVSGTVEPFIENETAIRFLNAFSEVTTGISFASDIGGIPFTSACVAFGGLCVMCQVIPYIKKCEIKISEYLFFRIVNGVMAYASSSVIMKFVNVTVAVSGEATASLWSENAPAGAALLIMGAMLVYETASERNVRIKISDITG